MKTFLTGPHAYGAPQQDDLVSCVMYVDNMPLIYLMENQCDECQQGVGYSIMFFDGMRFIVCDTLEAYTAWRWMTQTAVAEFEATGPLDDIDENKRFAEALNRVQTFLDD